MKVYEHCPTLKNERFWLRPVEKADCDDLWKVYSDEAAVPLFNSDNCHGDDFHYQTRERMAQAIDFWLYSYQNRFFVRWSILDRRTGHAVGTVELFRRESQDAFSGTALLRLDLRSDYERADELESILSLVMAHACGLFECASITTKAAPQATVRRAVLCQMGFQESKAYLVGEDGSRYDGYFVFTPA